MKICGIPFVTPTAKSPFESVLYVAHDNASTTLTFDSQPVADEARVKLDEVDDPLPRLDRMETSGCLTMSISLEVNWVTLA